MDTKTLGDRYAREEHDARVTVAGILSNTCVRPMLEAFRPLAQYAVAPLDRHLYNHIRVMLFAERAFDVAGVQPDGTQDPNPFTTWDLTSDERVIARRP